MDHHLLSIITFMPSFAALILAVFLRGDDAAAGARAGWSVGNLHLPMQVEGEIIRVADDPAIRQLFEQSNVPYREAKSIFAPMRVSTGSGDHSHSHSHSHDNGHSHG